MHALHFLKHGSMVAQMWGAEVYLFLKSDMYYRQSLRPIIQNIVNPFRCELGAVFWEGYEGCNDTCAVASTAAASCYAVSIKRVSYCGEHTGKPLTAGFFVDCIKERNILLLFMNIAASPLRSKGIFVNKNFKLLRESNLSGFCMLQNQC